MCSSPHWSPHWQVGQSPGRSWFREKLSPANGNKGYIAVSRFRKKMFPANPTSYRDFAKNIALMGAKNGVQHATAIYPIPRYTRPRYIGLTLYIPYGITRPHWFNSLRLMTSYDRSWSTIAQVMASCLTASSHCSNQYWLIISEVLWHSSKNNFTVLKQLLWIMTLKICYF